MEGIDIIVSGKVQGVFFRDSARHKAEALGVTGTVRNSMDGTVVIHAEGSSAALKDFVEWCNEGPPDAVVDHISVTPGTVRPYDEFRIEYT